MSRSVWSALGIAPTGDRREIRRAYAARLKAIDVDQDPEAFIALRHTLELALRMAAHHQLVDDDAQEHEPAPFEEEPEDDEDEDEDEDEWDWESPSHPSNSGTGGFTLSFTGVPGWTVAPEQGDPSENPAFAALEMLLYESGDPAQIIAATEALLASPMLESIDGAQDVEIWCARTILEHLPRADAMIVPAMRRFGWLEEDKSWTRRDLIARVMARHRDRWFLYDIAQPGHAHHRAWQALSQPFVARGAGRIAARVDALLQTIRGTHPSLAHDLDAESIARWEELLLQPRLSHRFWPITLFGPLLALFLPEMAGAGTAEAVPLLIGYLLLAGLAAGAQYATLRIERWAAALRESDWNALDAHPLAWGWIPALLLLPLIAALVPPSPATTLILAGLATGLATVAAAFRGSAYGESAEMAKKRRWYPIAAGGWWALAGALLVPGPWVQIAPPLLAACWIAAIAEPHIAERLDRLHQRTQRTAIAATAAAMAITLGWILATLPAPAPPAILALVPLSLIAMATLTRGVHLQLGWIGTASWVALVFAQNALAAFADLNFVQTAAISTACFSFGIGAWRLFRAWQGAR